MMKIRTPLGKWGKWRDDITPREKIAWSFISAVIGMTSGLLINRIGFYDWIIEVFNSLS